MATIYAGQVLLPDHVEEGWIQVEQGRTVAYGEGEAPAGATPVGWIVPTLVNAHTHVADSFLREREKPTNVAELVGPGGWKHRMLAEASHDEVAGGIVRTTDEMAATGTSRFLDFREGGVAGVHLLRALEPQLAVPPIIYGRPQQATFDEEEAAALLLAADGIGLSGLRDMPTAVLDDWADACRRAHKPLAIHVSEDQRDDIDRALSLEPAFVVHMVKGSRRDMEAVAAAGVPIVVCPRSNAHFNMRPPVEAMLDSDATVCLGTDNGMLASGDLLREVGALANTTTVAVPDLLRMATWNGRGLVDLPRAWPPQPRRPSELLCLPTTPFPLR